MMKANVTLTGYLHRAANWLIGLMMGLVLASLIYMALTAALGPLGFKVIGGTLCGALLWKWMLDTWLPLPKGKED